MDTSNISSDLLSQQTLVNQLKEKLQKNESILKGRENEFHELQTKFNKLKFLHKSKVSTATPDSTPTRTITPPDQTGSEPSTASDSAHRGKFLLLKKQLEESRALIHRLENENQEMKRELQELKDKQIKYEAERDDKDVEVISRHETTGEHSLDDMFAQIVYKDTKIMEMNQKVCDLEAKIMDLQENLKEQNQVLQARNRAIKLLLSQQQQGSAPVATSFEDVVQREEERERLEKLKERVAELEMEKGSLQLRVMELEGTNGSKPPLIDIELERDELSAQRDELKAKFNELMAKYDSLELQNDRLSGEKDRVNSELKKVKDTNNNLIKDKERQNADIERLNQMIAGIQSNYNLVNNELNALKAAIDDKETEIHSVRQQLSDLALKSKHIISEKDAKIVELTQQINDKSDDNSITERDQMIQELTRKLDEAKNESWSVLNINEELKEQCSQLEQRLARIQSEFDSRESVFERVLAEKADIEAQKERLNEEYTRDVQSLSEENSELRSRLETSFTQLSEYEQKFIDFTNKSDLDITELVSEIESLKKSSQNLKDSYSEKVKQLEDSVKSLGEELATLSEEKTNVCQQLESVRHELEEERQHKSSAVQALQEIESNGQKYNQEIGRRDDTIKQLEDELKKCQNIINEFQAKIEDFTKDKEESQNFIKDLETDLEDKIGALDKLRTCLDESERLVTEKTRLLDDMHEQRDEMEKRFEEAKAKNQGLAAQMENLIKLVEMESQEKDRLKQSLDLLQKENFEENDLIREKDRRIDSLQKEIRKQVEDMQEVEELLNQKTNEIETLTTDVTQLQKEKTVLEKMTEELKTKLNAITSESNEELDALKRDIEDLNEEIDYNKNEIKTLNDKLTELSRERQRLESREEENLSTIAELRKQLESQEMKLTEAMNELMRKSDDNTDTNLLLNEIQTLRQTVDELQAENQSLRTDFQTSILQLDASVNEYKALLDEARHQIDRLEAEKLTAVQETNKVNQVLEAERQTQSQIAAQNQELRLQIDNLLAEVNSLREQNQLESDSVHNERINQLNQVIEDLHKQNNELTAELNQLRHLAEELQHSSSEKFNELQERSESEKNELDHKVNQLQLTIDEMTADKQQYLSAYEDLKKEAQELSLVVQNRDIELANLKKLEESNQKSGQELSELNKRLIETQTTVQMLTEEKNRFEFAYNDLVHRYQELNHLAQTQTYEIESLKQLEISYKNLTECVNNLREEKNHLMTAINEKQESIERHIKEKETLIEQKQDIERSLRESEHNVTQLENRIQSMSEISVTQTTDSSSLAKEDELEKRVKELEEELQKSQGMYSENDSKLSEVEYELDILKKNYNLEMESLGAQLQERETAAERLQDRNDKLKRKIDKLNHQIKELTEKEAHLKGKLVESEGLIKYEQMQRETATDTRLSDLQQQVKETENNYQIEIMNLRADISNLMASEEQLKQRLQLYEQSEQSNAHKKDSEREIANYRSHIESLVNQLEAERIEKRRIQELFESSGQSSDQMNQLLAQMEAERQQYIAQKQELELKCKKFAAKFKVKEREVNALEQKLKLAKQEAKQEASKNVNEDELSGSDKKIEELTKKVDDLQFTASNLDSALQIERQKRRELENEKQTFWSQPSRASDITDTASSSFSLLIDEGNGNKSNKLFRKQLLRGPPNVRYMKIGFAIYLALLHLSVLYLCLF